MRSVGSFIRSFSMRFAALAGREKMRISEYNGKQRRVIRVAVSQLHLIVSEWFNESIEKSLSPQVGFEKLHR